MFIEDYYYGGSMRDLSGRSGGGGQRKSTSASHLGEKGTEKVHLHSPELITAASKQPLPIQTSKKKAKKQLV